MSSNNSDTKPSVSILSVVLMIPPDATTATATSSRNSPSSGLVLVHASRKMAEQDTQRLPAEDIEDEDYVPFWDFYLFAVLFQWIQTLILVLFQAAWSLASNHCVHQLLCSSSQGFTDQRAAAASEDRRIENDDGSLLIRFLVGTSTTTGSSKVRNSQASWPPPAFLVLAFFTLVTLIGHPDGFTWVLFDSIRYVV